MEQLNIINGDGRYVKEAVSEMLEPTIKCYGDKYAKIVLDTVKKAYFYEWQDNQTALEIIEEVTGQIQDDSLLSQYDDSIAALYLANEITKNRRDHIIIFRNKLLKENIHSLVHELYGHAVFGQVNYKVFLDGKEYNRNGISLVDNYGTGYDIIANEGYVDEFASMIMRIAGKAPEHSNSYALAKVFANTGITILGKETVLDHLILNQTNIKDEYNKGATKDEWQEISDILEECYRIIMKLSTNTNFNAQYIKYNQNINRFIERKIRRLKK
jgi:hypothetical protein